MSGQPVSYTLPPPCIPKAYPESSLALAELYLVISMMVRKFDMDLYGVTADNIVTHREYGFGVPKARGDGFRVSIKRVPNP